MTSSYSQPRACHAFYHPGWDCNEKKRRPLLSISHHNQWTNRTAFSFCGPGFCFNPLLTPRDTCSLWRCSVFCAQCSASNRPATAQIAWVSHCEKHGTVVDSTPRYLPVSTNSLSRTGYMGHFGNDYARCARIFYKLFQTTTHQRKWVEKKSLQKEPMLHMLGAGMIFYLFYFFAVLCRVWLFLQTTQAKLFSVRYVVKSMFIKFGELSSSPSKAGATPF